MVNNFFVGNVVHGKRMFKPGYSEKLVLYSDDNINYLDLINGIYYTTNESNTDYVERDSIISTDISEYKEDYLYLLNKIKNDGIVKKKLFERR